MRESFMSASDIAASLRFEGRERVRGGEGEGGGERGKEFALQVLRGGMRGEGVRGERTLPS
jgi:hypothetical protein